MVLSSYYISGIPCSDLSNAMNKDIFVDIFKKVKLLQHAATAKPFHGYSEEPFDSVLWQCLLQLFSDNLENTCIVVGPVEYFALLEWATLLLPRSHVKSTSTKVVFISTIAKKNVVFSSVV